MKEKPITVRRTGNIFSFAATEYEVTYPDGHVGKIWSPPWHELGRLRKANDEKDAILKKLRAVLEKAISMPHSVFFCGEHFSKIKDLLKEFPASADNGCSICNDPNCKTPGEQH